MTPSSGREEDQSGLWTYYDVASFLNVSTRTVQRWILNRQIPYVKFGRLVRFDPGELRAWVDLARQPASPLPSESPAIAELRRLLE